MVQPFFLLCSPHYLLLPSCWLSSLAWYFVSFLMPHCFFAEELVGLLMSASLFLALPMATLKGQHIRVSLLLDTLKSRSPVLRNALFTAGLLVGIGFTGWIFLESLPWMEFAIRRELKSETARILLYPLMSVVPISMIFCLVIYAAKVFGFIHSEER